MNAALVNGASSHALEVDDIYAPGLFHPGSPVIAAALAIAQQEQVSGLTFLQAVAAGYEVGGRLSKDLGRDHYEYWHTTGTVGTCASAIAAALLLGSDIDQLAHALAISATMTAGLQQTFRSDAMSKPVHAGHAAQAGVIAAVSAKNGLTGALDVFEGEVGLGKAMGGVATWESSQGQLSSPLVIEQVTVKPYPCCGHTFAAIDAALELRASINISDIEAIEIHTYTTATQVAGIERPTTPAEARFSLAYSFAAALVDGHINAQTFEAVVESDPQIQTLLSCTTLVASPTFDEVFPSRRGARVDITMNDGSPERALTQAQIQAKFMDLVAQVLGQAAGEQLLAQIQELPDRTTLEGFGCDSKKG